MHLTEPMLDDLQDLALYHANAAGHSDAQLASKTTRGDFRTGLESSSRLHKQWAGTLLHILEGVVQPAAGALVFWRESKEDTWKSVDDPAFVELSTERQNDLLGNPETSLSSYDLPASAGTVANAPSAG